MRRPASSLVMNDYGPSTRNAHRPGALLHVAVGGYGLCFGGPVTVTHHGTSEPSSVCPRCRRLYAAFGEKDEEGGE